MFPYNDGVGDERWPFEEILEKPGVTDAELLAWMEAIHEVTRPETVLLLRPLADDEDRGGLVRAHAARLVESFPRGRCPCD